MSLEIETPEIGKAAAVDREERLAEKSCVVRLICKPIFDLRGTK